MFWPIIPLYWIPVHLGPVFFKKKPGNRTYLLVFLSWALAACVIYLNRAAILAERTQFPVSVEAAGLVLLAAGIAINLWTADLLTWPGIIGIPETSQEPGRSRLVDRGAFAVVRHPTYLAHTLILLGVFLFTGVEAAGVLALADFVVVNAVVIPLEEKELLERLGEPYRQYMARVPRIVPRINRRR
jgi:protein-S-isoprenylcysteine O-methyltransferase Ste14